MGLSVASLFGYRNGTIPVSVKGWSKLEQAEKRFPPPDPKPGFVYSEGKVKEFINWAEENETVLREDATPYRTKADAKNAQEAGGSRMERALERIALALEKLVEIQQTKAP